MYNIYIIKNDLNDKVYIGITQLSIERRFKNHIRHSYDKKHQGLIYQEMRRLGRKHFYIELLEQTEDKSKESYYIYKYDSIKNGYNEKTGACIISKEELYDAYVNKKLSSRKICNLYNIKSKTTILSLIKMYGIKPHTKKLDLPEEEIINKLKNGSSLRSLAKEYNVDRDVIRRIKSTI